jgi:hypothetical protein
MVDQEDDFFYSDNKNGHGIYLEVLKEVCHRNRYCKSNDFDQKKVMRVENFKILQNFYPE